MAANVFVKFGVKLQDKFHQFRSEKPSSIRQGGAECKLNGSFASYDFFANKAQLGALLNNNSIDVTLLHHDGDRVIGQLKVPLKMLEQGE